MIKHLKPRSELELKNIERRKYLIKLIKIFILAIITSPFGILMLIASLIILPLFIITFFVFIAFMWLRDINDEKDWGNISEFWYMIWRIPGIPFIWYLNSCFNAEIKDIG